MDPAVTRAITQIPDDAWVPIKYPHAIYDEDEHRWVSAAWVAEIAFTAFTSRRRDEHIGARLIVRRVKALNPATVPAGQGALFATWRHHAVFTDSVESMLTAEATTATIHARLIAVPARIARSGRQRTTRLRDLTTQPQRRNKEPEVEDPDRPAADPRPNQKRRTSDPIRPHPNKSRWIEAEQSALQVDAVRQRSSTSAADPESTDRVACSRPARSRSTSEPAAVPSSVPSATIPAPAFSSTISRAAPAAPDSTCRAMPAL
jgi:hypothetical protein